MKSAQRPLITVVRRTDRRDVFLAHHAPRPDRLLGPLDDPMSVPLQPDVRQHPGPAPVAVQERMDLHRPMMESDRLGREALPLNEQRARAGSVVLLVDSSKFQSQEGSILCPLNKVTTVVTDDGVSDSVVRMIKKAGPKLIVAKAL